MIGDRRDADEQAVSHAAAEAARRIADKVEDAAAHAVTALTETLRNTSEGRPTAAKVRRSRSYQAALARLDDLTDELVNLTEEFRVAHYRMAYPLYHEAIAEIAPHVLRSPNPDPPAALVERARTALVLGYTARRFLGGKVEQVKGQLVPTLTVAGNRATRRGEARVQLQRWASAARESITRTTSLWLVSSQTLCDKLAGRDCIQPNRLHPDPSLPD